MKKRCIWLWRRFICCGLNVHIWKVTIQVFNNVFHDSLILCSKQYIMYQIVYLHDASHIYSCTMLSGSYVVCQTQHKWMSWLTYVGVVVSNIPVSMDHVPSMLVGEPPHCSNALIYSTLVALYFKLKMCIFCSILRSGTDGSVTPHMLPGPSTICCAATSMPCMRWLVCRQSCWHNW